MPKDTYLKTTLEFDDVRRRGRVWSDEWFVLITNRNQRDVGRVGFAVGKRVGNAVTRNRIKRRLREVVRKAPRDSGWDLLIIARQGAASVDFCRLRRSVVELFGRAGILSA